MAPWSPYHAEANRATAQAVGAGSWAEGDGAGSSEYGLWLVALPDAPEEGTAELEEFVYADHEYASADYVVQVPGL